MLESRSAPVLDLLPDGAEVPLPFADFELAVADVQVGLVLLPVAGRRLLAHLSYG